MKKFYLLVVLLFSVNLLFAQTYEYVNVKENGVDVDTCEYGSIIINEGSRNISIWCGNTNAILHIPFMRNVGEYCYEIENGFIHRSDIYIIIYTNGQLFIYILKPIVKAVKV